MNEIYARAVEIAKEQAEAKRKNPYLSGTVGPCTLQRRLRIGFSRAAGILEEMRKAGLVEWVEGYRYKWVEKRSAA